MYRAIKLDLNIISIAEDCNVRFVYEGSEDVEAEALDICYEKGSDLFRKHEKFIWRGLSQCVDGNGNINASKLQEQWFSNENKYDIFISHSHKDVETAKLLSGLFSKVFGLSTFIDSCVWGHCDKLQKMLDDKYCKNKYEDTYNYTKRNFTTAHVHHMLSNALSKTMNNCELVIFLNSDNSTSANGRDFVTKSPWIYYELNIIDIIKIVQPLRDKRYDSKHILKNINESFFPEVYYTVDFSKMTNITFDQVAEWFTEYINITEDEEHTNNVHPLDLLYKIISKQKYY